MIMIQMMKFIKTCQQIAHAGYTSSSLCVACSTVREKFFEFIELYAALVQSIAVCVNLVEI